MASTKRRDSSIRQAPRREDHQALSRSLPLRLWRRMGAPASVARGGIAGLVLLLTLAAAALLLFAPGPVAAQSDTTDYDVDNDGLIDIDSLAKLNAIRWDLNGDGQVASGDQEKYDAAFPNAAAGMGCHSIDHDGDAATDNQPVCKGYELTANLTFDSNTDNVIDSADAAYWNDGAGWVPIITLRGGRSRLGYSAIFEGNGHTIDYLFINRPDGRYAGLFGQVDAPGRVRNLTLRNVNVTSLNCYVGGLIGSNARGIVSDVAVSGRVAGLYYVGGLVGSNASTIERSSFSGSVTGKWFVGGLVGNNESKITHSSSDATVKGEHMVGGLVGVNYSKITHSSSDATVSGKSGVGGLVGWSVDGSIVSSYATGDVTATLPVAAAAGGLVGKASGGLISESYATGTVSGRHSGGLAGRTNDDSTIRDSYATGAVEGNSAGGLVGYNGYGYGGSSITSRIITSYATGAVEGDGTTGGLVGANGSGDLIAASYATGPVNGRRAGGFAGHNYGTIRDSYSSGTVTGKRYTGGFIGRNLEDGSVLRSYASGEVNLADDAEVGATTGGFIGLNGPDATATDSYWDTTVSRRSTTSRDLGTGKTTTQLQTPTGYTGIYASWHVDVDNADGDHNPATGKDDLWDFGTSSQYPALKADWDDDGTATAAEFGGQARQARQARRSLDGVAQSPVDYDLDDDGLIDIDSLAQLNALRWDLNGDGQVASGDQASYAAAFPNPAAGMGCHSIDHDGSALTPN